MLFFNVPFPLAKFEYNFKYTILRPKKTSAKFTTGDLSVYGDMIYCDNCKFTSFYNVEDSILILKKID